MSLRLVEIEPQLERQGPALDGVVVGRVLTVEAHPNAERLRVTTVDVGAPEALGIVCGARTSLRPARRGGDGRLDGVDRRQGGGDQGGEAARGADGHALR